MRILIFLALIILMQTNSAFANDRWKYEWPDTDFSKSSINFDDIISGGPPKDGIKSIDKPIFEDVANIKNIGEDEPVISLNIDGDIRAYPIRILMFHEIVNDIVGKIPVSVTYCPLCNASLVFDRRLDGEILEFGTTGKLRLSDMVMYDRQSESWWQQFTGVGIVGKYTDKQLKILPSRIESFALFKKRYPKGKVQIPNKENFGNYGFNPYVNYDSSKWPFLFNGEYDDTLKPLARVIAIGNDAWPLELLQKKKRIEYKEITITWQSGQNSALDSGKISKGRDIGNIIVTKNGEDVVHHIPFAFAFKAFNKKGIIHKE